MSDDAKPMTTADVEAMPTHTAIARECTWSLPNHVLVRRDELLATTRERDELRAALQRAFQWLPDDEVNEMEAERVLAFGKD